MIQLRPLAREGDVRRNHAFRCVIAHNAPLMQPHHPVAEVQHLPRRVGDEENRLALRPEMPHPRHALLREARIAHAQRLIHNQDFGVHVGGNGESQPGAHSAGIRPQGLVDVHANIRKINNLLLDLGDFALLHAHQHTLIGNVLAPGQLVIHADVCCQHTDRAADLAEPQIRLGDARDDTRQRRFAGAVQPRQPDDFAAVEVLRHATERRKFLHVRPKTQQRLQAVFFLAVQVVDLRQFPAADDYIRQAHRPLSAEFLPIKWC